jgi:hypothetical protein
MISESADEGEPHCGELPERGELSNDGLAPTAVVPYRSSCRIEKKLVPGRHIGLFGHIGLFMGSRTLKETWPTIAQWLTHSGAA